MTRQPRLELPGIPKHIVQRGNNGLLLYPILLGRGKRLFDDHTQASAFRLEESKASSHGVPWRTDKPLRPRGRGRDRIVRATLTSGRPRTPEIVPDTFRGYFKAWSMVCGPGD